ncbi:hypothetical protein BSPWISOXPB_3227 [uncultured Gammaproteobacteria bacterium]|nr:hypothetical protein BSPWISOXPB_3227 [uncultured Gammaproteobacteria bacterium]
MYTIKIKADIKKLRKKKKKERIVRTLFLKHTRYIYTHIYIGNNPTNRILIPRPKESIKITESNILQIKKTTILQII